MVKNICRSFGKKLWSKLMSGGIRVKLLALLCLVLVLLAFALLIGVYALQMKPGESVWWAWTHMLDPGFLGDDKDNQLRQVWGSVFSVTGLLVIGGAFLTLAEEAARSTVERLMNGKVPHHIFGHTVVAGNGAGKLRACINALPEKPDEEKLVIAVPGHDALTQIRSALKHDATIVVSQPEDLNLHQAQRIILLENYGHNAGEMLRVINAVYDRINERNSTLNALEIYVEVNNRLLSATMRTAINRLGRDCSRVHLHILNVADASARLAIRNHPLDCLPILPGGQRRVTLVIEGWTAFAQALFWQALRTAHYPVKPTRILVVHHDASQIKNDVLTAAPGLSDAWVRSDLLEVSFLQQFDPCACDIRGEDAVSYAICSDNPDSGFASALQLQEQPFQGLWQIYLELPEGSGYRDVIKKIGNNSSSHKAVVLIAVGPSDEAIDFEEKLDGLAQKIHAHYQEKYNDVSWEKLDETKRAWNRSPADHLQVKLRMLAALEHERYPQENAAAQEVRLKTLIKHLAGHPENGNTQLDKYVDLLSRLEHDRWCAEKYADGWVYADKRDNAAKKHHLLVPYDDLSEAEQLKDWETMKIVLSSTLELQ